MKQISLNLVISDSKGDKKKLLLQKTIGQRRILLQELVVKTEMLKVNLEMTRQEYMVKIGNLFAKDNQLDFEIIRLRNILQYMKQGHTYDEATTHTSQMYYAEQLAFERENEQIHFEEEQYQKREANNPKPTEDIKKIWKKLIAKFHPDLVQDSEEKQKRDTIMKQINRAYQENNYDQLAKIDEENMPTQELTIDNLEDILVRIIKEIMQQRQQYQDLKKSEWYSWMIRIQKAKKTNINIFAETEKHLLDDIVAKMDLIKKITQQIEEKKN
jgi:hypothetical protein